MIVGLINYINSNFPLFTPNFALLAYQRGNLINLGEGGSIIGRRGNLINLGEGVL